MSTLAMGAWEKLTSAEKHCYYLFRNGFKQCEIAILKSIETGVVRSHMHSGKIKAECDTIDEALGDFINARCIEKMPEKEKQDCRTKITEYIAKYGPKKG